MATPFNTKVQIFTDIGKARAEEKAYEFAILASVMIGLF
jgi:hypothetical protein